MFGESVAGQYTSAAGTFTMNTLATYSVTVTATWSGLNAVVAFGVTINGGIRIVTSAGDIYMGTSGWTGTQWISTLTIIHNFTAVETFQVLAYNITAGALTINPFMEITRLHD